MDEISIYFARHWQVALASLALLLLATELGFHLGRRYRPRLDEAARTQVSIIQGAILALLGLIIGFTYSMSISRFELRKEVLLDEANAIGTTYLRAEFLPEPYRTEVKSLLRRYVEVRVEFCAAGADMPRANRAEGEIVNLQRELWSRTAAVAGREPRLLTTNLFIQSLNETIDLDAKQLFALENHVPQAVWLVVYTLASLALFTTGAACGLGGARSVIPNLVMPFAIAILLILAVDLDRPRQGLVRMDQKTLLRLRDSMGAAP